MARKDYSWSSIDQLREELSTLGARHLIDKIPPVFSQRGRKISRLEPIGGTVTPVVGLGEESGTERLNTADNSVNWRNLLADEEASRGIDALAWYLSFHNIDTDWGIFIPISSLHYIAETKLKKLRLTYKGKLEIAFEALLTHESVHYAIDRNIASWELLLGIPVHGMVPDRLKFSGYIPIEEAVANAHMLREMANHCSRTCISALESWVVASPKGYCDGPEYVESDAFDSGLEECVKSYVGEQWFTNIPRASGIQWINWASQFPLDGPVDVTRCPVFLIDDQLGLGVLPTSVKYLEAIPEIIQSRKFLKMLHKAPKHIQEIWERKCETLKIRIPAYPEFEKLRGALAGLFSIRVGDKYRAHLKPSKKNDVWEAIAIGTHRAMGHG